jgi:hypothetical protein
MSASDHGTTSDLSLGPMQLTICKNRWDNGIPVQSRVGKGCLESDGVGVVGDHTVIIDHAQTPSTPCLEFMCERKIGFGL